jgi:hypothetical protein
VLERHLGRRQEPRELEQEPAGNDDRALGLDLRLERGSQRDLTVVRVETPRETIPSACRSSSREQTVLSVPPVTTASVASIIYEIPLS